MAYTDAGIEDIPPPEASSTAPRQRSVTVLDNDPPPDTPAPAPASPPRYHQHPPVVDPVTGKPTGDTVTDTGQYGSPIVKAYPPESYEPYIRSQRRPWDQWGIPDFSQRGPYMPGPRDIPQLIHNVVMGLGRWGSHYTGMPAIAMGTYANAYWTAYQKGMKERAAQNWQQYRQARQMTLDRQKEETEAAKEIYTLYKDNPARLKLEMQQLATRYQDQNLANAIARGPEFVDALLADRDTHWHDLAKAKQIEDERRQLMDLRAAQERRRQEKEKRDAEARKRLDDERRRIDPNAGPAPPGADAGGGGGAEEPIIPPVGGGGAVTDTAPDTDTSPDTDTLPDADTASDTPVQTADASGQVPITRGVSDLSGAGAQAPAPGGKPETPFLEEAAKGWVFSNKTPASLGKKGMEDLQQRAENRGEQLKAWLDKLENDPSIDPNSISPAIRKVFPSLADKIDGYLSGNRNAPQASRADPEWKRAIDIASHINPNFSQGTFQSRQQGLRAWTAGDRGQNLSSLGIAMKHALTLYNDLADKPGGNLPIGGATLSEIYRRFGSKGIQKIDGTIDLFTEEFVRAMSGKGPTIPEIRNEKEKLNLSYPSDYLRGLVQKEIYNLQTKLREKQAQFAAETGFPATDIMKRFKNYTDTDPMATNRDRDGASGLELLDKWKPSDGDGGGGSAHTPDEIAGARKWLADPKNVNDPRRSKIQQMIGQ